MDRTYELAKILYRRRCRWGDWNSLGEGEKVNWVKVLDSKLVDAGKRGQMGLLIHSFTLHQLEQLFWSALRPFRRFLLFVLGR